MDGNDLRSEFFKAQALLLQCRVKTSGVREQPLADPGICPDQIDGAQRGGDACRRQGRGVDETARLIDEIVAQQRSADDEAAEAAQCLAEGATCEVGGSRFAKHSA